MPLPKFNDYDIKIAVDVLKFQCGDGVKIIINKADDIPVPTSGKFRYIISEIKS